MMLCGPKSLGEGTQLYCVMGESSPGPMPLFTGYENLFMVQGLLSLGISLSKWGICELFLHAKKYE